MPDTKEIRDKVADKHDRLTRIKIGLKEKVPGVRESDLVYAKKQLGIALDEWFAPEAPETSHRQAKHARKKAHRSLWDKVKDFI